MLRRTAIIQSIIFAVGQIVLCTTTQASLITMTGAAQQVGGEIGYSEAGDNFLAGALDPDPDPQGEGNADLGVAVDSSGVSLVDSLATVFSDDQVTGDGSAFASAEWGSQPLGAEDVYGGGGSTFTLNFTRESANPVYFYVSGQLDIDLENYPDLNPTEVLAYVRLSNGSGEPWEAVIDGTSGNISLPFDHGLWLESDTTYFLEVYAESGTMADETHSAFKSRTASFSFAATAGEVTADIVPDTISTNTKSLTCYIWPPNGLDVTQIDQSNIRLNADISPSRISVRNRQQMLVVKFPTSQLDLTPTAELPLTVTGGVIGGPSFSASDSVAVVQKGGKPS